MSRVSTYIYRLGYLTQIISLIILIYILIAHILQVMSLDIFIDPKIFNLSYLKFLISISFTTAFIGLLISLFFKKTPYIGFFSISWKEKISYLFISTILSNLFVINDVGLTVIDKGVYLLIFISFLCLLPSLAEMYSKINFLNFKYVPTHSVKIEQKSQLVLFLALLATFVVFSVNTFSFANIIYRYINGDVAIELEHKRNLYLEGVYPGETVPAQKAMIYGYNLGWKRDSRSRIMSSDGEIPSSIWTNDKIYFEIPLHLKVGVRQIWVEKPRQEDKEKSEIIESNKVALKIDSRFDYYPEAGDIFFIRQLKKIKRMIFLN